jgi:hypothetical protein
MNPPSKRPEIIVVPHRPRRWSKGFGLPILIILVATVGLGLRAASPNWRGLSDELRGRLGSLFARREAPSEPIAIAKAETPPVAAPKPAAEEAKPEVAKPKDQTAWDDIQHEADKLKAERAEAEKLKEQAAEDLANSPPPPPRRRAQINPNGAAFIAEMQRRNAAFRQMDAQMRGDLEAHQRMFDEMRQRFAQDFARNAPRGFGNLPPDFGRFAAPLPGMDRMIAPLPGMDRMIAPLPGQPRVHEESGEEVRDGVRRVWKTRIVIMGQS